MQCQIKRENIADTEDLGLGVIGAHQRLRFVQRREEPLVGAVACDLKGSVHRLHPQ